MKANGKAQRIELGHFIVADPRICHGKPTFKGTRIMVWQVLEDVAEGKSWDFISQVRWGWTPPPGGHRRRGASGSKPSLIQRAVSCAIPRVASLAISWPR